MSTATAGAPPDTGIPGNPYDKLYHYDDEDYYDPHCFFSSGLAQNRKRLGFIATCSTVQCKDAGSAGTFLTLCQPFFLFVFAMSYVSVKIKLAHSNSNCLGVLAYHDYFVLASWFQKL